MVVATLIKGIEVEGGGQHCEDKQGSPIIGHGEKQKLLMMRKIIIATSAWSKPKATQGNEVKRCLHIQETSQ